MLTRLRPGSTPNQNLGLPMETPTKAGCKKILEAQINGALA